MDTSAIKALIQQKLDAAVTERDELKEQRDKLSEKLDGKLKFAPERPMYGADEIDSRLRRLQEQQSTSSMNLAEEKKLLREIQSLKAMKGSIGPYSNYQSEIDTLRTQRGECIERLKALGPTIAELRTGLRKLEILEKVRAANPGLRIQPQDIMSEDVPVGDEHLPRLIGKAGSGLREIEAACGVVLDVDDPSRRRDRDDKEKDKDAGPATVKVSGLAHGIKQAMERISAITSQIESPVPVSAAIAGYLISRGGQGMRDMETTLGVRIRLDKEEGKCYVRGLPGAIVAFKKAVEDAEASKVSIVVDPRSVPSIIGKGGAHFKKLREDTGCEVEVGAREEGKPVTITLVSMGPSAASCLSLGQFALSALKTEHEELDFAIPIPRDAIIWLVGKGGEKIQAWQKEAGVYARIARKEADGSISGAEGLQPSMLGPEGAAVVLRANRAALNAARPKFDALMAEYRRCNYSQHMSAGQVKAIIGPNGATIKKLRTETGCAIEVDEATDPSKPAKEREDKKDKDEKEDRRRPNRADEMGLAPGQALLTIRGEADKVPAAVAAVAALVKSFREAKVPASGPMLNALIRNKGELIRSLQDETGAALDIVRDPAEAASEVSRRAQRGPGGRLLSRPLYVPASGYVGVVVASGPETAVSAAELKLEQLLASKQETSLPLPDASAVPEFMGKGGAAIRALQDETGTEVDVLKSEGLITVVGSAEGVASAVARITAFFTKYGRENASVKLDKGLLPALIGKGGAGLRALESETGVSIKVEGDGTVNIHGPEDKVPVAKARIVEACKLDKPTDSLAVDVAILGRLIGRGGGNLRKIEEAHGVIIGVDNTTGVFTARGEVGALSSAMAALRKQAKEAGRAEVEVEVPQERLGGIIGAKGSRLRQLEAETACSIDLPRDRTSKTVTVKARGTDAGVERAKVVLTALAQGKAVRVLTRLGPHATELQGRDRPTLERLQDEYGVTIGAWGPEPSDDEEGAQPSITATLVITGDNDAAVGKAVAGVDRLLAYRFGEGFAVVAVPSGMGASLQPAAAAEGAEAATGAEAVTLADLKDKFGVGASYEKEGSYVALWGAPRSVGGARAVLQSGAAAFNARHGEVEVEAWMLPAFIGKKGSGISSLESESGCKINIDRDAGAGKAKAAIRIAAPNPGALVTGKAAVEARVATVAKTRVLLRVPPPAFGGIIGKGGAVIRSIQDDTGANLDLDRECGVVTVRGIDEASAVAAQARVVDIVTEAGFNAKVATAAEVSALTVELADISKDLLAPVSKAFGDLAASSGASISLSKDNSSVVVVKGSSPEEVAAGVRAVRSAVDKQRRGAAQVAAPAPAAAAAQAGAPPTVPKVFPNRPIGAPPPTAEELAAEAGKKSRNARRRAKAKAAKAGGPSGAASEAGDDEEEVTVTAPARAAASWAPAPAFVAPVAQPVQARPAPVAAAPAPAPVRAAAPAPAPTAKPTAAPVASPTKPLSTEEMLAQLLGSNYKELLAGGHAPAPAPAVAPKAAPAAPPVAARPPPGLAPVAKAPAAAVPAAAPSPVKRPAAGPPPGFPNTPQHAPLTAASPMKAAAPAAAAGPVWGSKGNTSLFSAPAPAPSASSGAGLPGDDIASQLAALGISSTAFPTLAPTGTGAAGKAAGRR